MEEVRSGRELATSFAGLLEEERCRDVAVLDVRGLTDLCDYMVLATGLNRPQMKAAMARLEEESREWGAAPLPAPDHSTERWMTADYIDVTVHLFSEEARGYYDLELIWGDAGRVDFRSAATRTNT